MKRSVDRFPNVESASVVGRPPTLVINTHVGTYLVRGIPIKDFEKWCYMDSSTDHLEPCDELIRFTLWYNAQEEEENHGAGSNKP